MIIGRIQGWTRLLGKTQGYLGLPVRDGLMVVDEATGQTVPIMETVWEPTPAEVASIVAGAPILLTVMGTGHPPVKLEVGPVPS